MNKKDGLETTLAGISAFARRQLTEHAEWLEKMGEDVDQFRDLVTQSDEEILWWLGRQTEFYLHEIGVGQMEDLAASYKKGTKSSIFSLGDWVTFYEPMDEISGIGLVCEILDNGYLKLDTIKPKKENSFVIQQKNCNITNPPPLDKNGELIELNDLVVDIDGDIGRVRVISPNAEINADWLMEEHIYQIPVGIKDKDKFLTKITSLTAKQYLPLARRTLSPELQGDDETSKIARRMYLAIGLIGEWHEFEKNPTVEEAGDVLWYAHQLDEEFDGYCNENGERLAEDWPFNETQGSVFEAIKKAVVHGRGEYQNKIGRFINHVIDFIEDKFDGDDVRFQNIKKLLDRYPEGFEKGGGNR